MVPSSGEFADDDDVADVAAGDHAAGREHAQRDRQVVRGARLPHIGRRQVDDDAVLGKLEAGIANRRVHAIAALAHPGVGQADQLKAGQAEAQVDLDVHGTGLDADDGGALEAREHAR